MKTPAVLLATALAFGALCDTRWCAAQVVAHAELQADVRVEGRAVTLRDIAKLSGASAEQLDALGKVPLAKAPQPGYTMRLSQREVLRLVHEAGLPEILLDGANATNVTTLATPYDTERLIAVAKSSLTTSLQREGLSLAIAANGTIPELRLPPGEVTLRTRSITAERPRSQMVVWVDVQLEGRFYRSVPVSLNVTAMTSVLVARSDLRKGQTVGCDNVDLVVRDVALLPSAAQPSDCAQLQRRARRNLAAGEVLLASELEAIPAISEGESVTLEVNAGAVTLESRALALTDGQVGQEISVRASLSEEPVLALVVAPGVVKMSAN